MSQDQTTNQSWGGRFSEPVDAFVARFTASVDFDKRLYKHDIQGSIAHATMLARVGVLSEAERDSIELKKVEFMERHLGEEFSGTISGVTAFGLFVLLDDYFVEGLVHVSNLEDDYYVYLEEQLSLVGEHRRRRFQLGDRVKIQVASVNRDDRKIDFLLVPE